MVSDQATKAQTRRLVCQYLLTVFLVGFAISICGLLVSKEAAVGIVFGALISLLPQSYFALQAFRISAAQQPEKAYFAIMRGESGKFVLTAVLFALLFKFRPDVSAPAVFTGFAVILVTQIISGGFLVKKLTAQQD